MSNTELNPTPVVEKKKKFYDTFQIGLEIEGSFLKGRREVDNAKTHSGQDLTSDGSIQSISEGGNNFEIRSQIIKTEDSESKFIEFMNAISKEHNKETIFAYRNKSCGTHVHFSLKDGDINKQNRLRVFDSIDFERYFFERYLKTFKLQKFSERLSNNRYCRLFVKDLAPNSVPNQYGLAEVELEKGSRDRYYWLNVESLMQGKGMEIRIFPYLQTSNGVQEIINFTKQVIMEYWNKPSVQRKADLIERYYNELAGKRIVTDKLNAYEQVLYKVLYIERSELKHSADTIVFLMELFKQKPSAFESQAF